MNLIYDSDFDSFFLRSLFSPRSLFFFYLLENRILDVDDDDVVGVASSLLSILIYIFPLCHLFFFKERKKKDFVF